MHRNDCRLLFQQMTDPFLYDDRPVPETRFHRVRDYSAWRSRHLLESQSNRLNHIRPRRLQAGLAQPLADGLIPDALTGAPHDGMGKVRQPDQADTVLK